MEFNNIKEYRAEATDLIASWSEGTEH
jgi:hypothetical protein